MFYIFILLNWFVYSADSDSPTWLKLITEVHIGICWWPFSHNKRNFVVGKNINCYQWRTHARERVHVNTTTRRRSYAFRVYMLLYNICVLYTRLRVLTMIQLDILAPRRSCMVCCRHLAVTCWVLTPNAQFLHDAVFAPPPFYGVFRNENNLVRAALNTITTHGIMRRYTYRLRHTRIYSGVYIIEYLTHI